MVRAIDYILGLWLCFYGYGWDFFHKGVFFQQGIIILTGFFYWDFFIGGTYFRYLSIWKDFVWSTIFNGLT